MSRPEDVLARLRELRAGDLPTHGGRTLAYVYDSGLSEVDSLGAAAHALASSANGLDPTAFPSLLKMENDLVAAAAALLGFTAVPALLVGAAVLLLGAYRDVER